MKCKSRVRIWNRLLLPVLLMLSLTELRAQQDPGWPRETVHPEGVLVTYPPQADDWKNFRDLTWRQAFSLTPTGGKKVVGAASFEGTTDVDNERHMVLITDLKINHIDFPSLDPDTAAKMEKLVRTFLPPSVPISLERIVACVKKPETVPTVNLKNDPPPIFVSYRPFCWLWTESLRSQNCPKLH